MWIVRLALRHPYTFTVMALLIVILGVVSSLRMAVDIFPSIDIPVVSVVWQYGGLNPDEMEKRIVTLSERSMTTTVNDIEHIESESLLGVGVIKVFFHPGTSIDAAVAQITAVSQPVIHQMPPGTTPPLVIRYSATNVPILQLGLGSPTISEQTLFDLGLNFVRVPLATVEGASIPLPSGGKQRQIEIDLNPQALQAHGLTPADVSGAINAQSLTLPSGTVKIGDHEFGVLLNNSPSLVSDLGDLPVAQVRGTTVYIRDVAQVRDGFAPQTSIIRQDGKRGVLITIMKNGAASTLDIINQVKAALPRIKSTLPPELKLVPLLDQSIFVRAALNGVVREAVLAALLTAAMILLFLGTWRNTLVVTVSIPLSILCSLICLEIFGQTINAMTLGGLALAVGILVDDATVEIENIERNLGMHKPLTRAILDGAQQIAVPAFVSTLCICIVFVPIFFLTGVVKFLFSPLAMAVIFAMLASYFLSRTVVPTFVHFLWIGRQHPGAEGHGGKTGDVFWRVHQRFNVHFERFRAHYLRLLEWCLEHRGTVGFAMAGVALFTAGLAPFLGRDFFPLVDAGSFRLHVRAPTGTRIEETERLFTRVDQVIREEIPADELVTILDNIGLPNSGLNLASSDLATVGTGDGEILVSLNQEKHAPTWGYVRRLRARLNREFPDCKFFTQSSDIVGQILNFGLPAPIDLQIAGRDRVTNFALAEELSRRVAAIPGAVDVHVHQVVDEPYYKVTVDRTRAEELGLNESNIASNLLISLSGSGQVAPNFWLSPENGVQYLVATQTPQFRIDSLRALLDTPIGISRPAGTPEILGNVATAERITAPAVVTHYDVQPVFDVYANIDGSDLGSVAGKVSKLLPDFRRRLPRGSDLKMRGQVQSMNDSFSGIGIGVLFAIVLVYLLMVVNFQSWLDPLIIIMALPGALSGIVWMLYLTGTTINVPSLMGAIMSVGVATANSILIVTFANDQRKEGQDARAAAVAAGSTRLRPVLMTAFALILGMRPMALGLGEGGEQNAPLGRRCHRRPDRRDHGHAPRRAGRLRHPAQTRRPSPGGADRRGDARIPQPTDFPLNDLKPFAPLSSWRSSPWPLEPGLLPRCAPPPPCHRRIDGPVRGHASVTVTVARRAATASELLLPGTLQPFVDTPIYARTNGYLAKWLVDIGDTVKAGQTLATIDSPEVDQELNQGKANLEQARANLELARVSAERWKALGAQHAVAQQDVDQKAADFAAQQANVTAAQSNVGRLEQLQRFETVTAPFDGVVSARNVDTGALINAGSGPELFHLTQSDILRAYVNVPQTYVPDIKVGLPVDVLVAEFPHESFSGEVARFSSAMDATSRTLLVQVQIPNGDHRLFAGMFCQLRFTLPRGHPTLLIPSNDAVIRANGTTVAVLAAGNTLHWQKVTLGRDFGTQFEVLDGLLDGARVVDNPSDALSEGETVDPVSSAAAGGKP